MRAFAERIHRYLAESCSTRRYGFLIGAALVACVSTWTYAITVATPLAAPKWRLLPVDYTYTYTSSPDSPNPDVQTRGLSLSFPNPTHVEVSGSALPFALSPTYDFDSAELARPNADNSIVVEPVNWLSLPPFVGEPLVGDVLTRVGPTSIDDSRIVLRGISTFTITAVSSTEIGFTGVDTSELVATSALREYAAFLVSDPGQVDAMVSDLQSEFEGALLAEYHVVFDRVRGSISSISAVWQKIPDSTIDTLSELRSLPNRVQLEITRN